METKTLTNAQGGVCYKHMKKYRLALSVFLFAFGLVTFNINSASAYDSGCTGAGPYSTTTGKPCGTIPVVECALGHLFSLVTGKPCVVSGGGGSGGSSGGISSNQELTIGSRGNGVVVLQEILKDEGYYLGKIDGNYGPRTARAVREFQEDNDLPITGRVDAATRAVLNNIGNVLVKPSSPVISGVKGPQTLNVNEQGTWGVTASDSSGGNLSYSVVWGDENVYPYGTANSLRSPLAQQSATFTHSYLQAGTYKPIFTVANDRGQSAQTSLSVKVGGIISTNSSPIINKTGFTNPSDVKIGQSASFKWYATDADNDDLSWLVNWGEVGVAGAIVCPVNPPKGTGQNWNYNASHTWTQAGTYTVKVTVNDCRGGIDSNSFTVNVGTIISSVTITSLSPTSGPIGTNVTVYGSGFIKYLNCYPNVCDPIDGMGNTVNFGNGVIRNIYSYDGTSINFTVPTNLIPACAYASPNPCLYIQVITSPGPYSVSVTNANGTSNALNFTVTGSTSPLAITTSSPLPNAKVGANYETTVVATGGDGSYSWGVSSGSLPPGFIFGVGVCAAVVGPCKSPAVISGNPKIAATYNFTVKLNDGNFYTNKQFTLTVDPADNSPLPLLIASPSSVPIGGSVTVNFGNVANPTSSDWVGLYTVDITDDKAYIDWKYTSTCSQTAGPTGRTSGNCSFTIVNPGTYEFRLFAVNGYDKLATSNTVTVTSSTIGATGSAIMGFQSIPKYPQGCSSSKGYSVTTGRPCNIY